MAFEKKYYEIILDILDFYGNIELNNRERKIEMSNLIISIVAAIMIFVSFGQVKKYAPDRIVNDQGHAIETLSGGMGYTENYTPDQSLYEFWGLTMWACIIALFYFFVPFRYFVLFIASIFIVDIFKAFK